MASISHLPTCREVRANLPLAVGEDSDPNPGLDDHLLRCPDCREYRVQLSGSMAALATAITPPAATTTYSTATASQWPAVRQQIVRPAVRPATSPVTAGRVLATLAATCACGLVAFLAWPSGGVNLGPANVEGQVVPAAAAGTVLQWPVGESKHQPVTDPKKDEQADR